MLCNINVWAVLIASVVSIVIASLWYSPFAFAKQWVTLSKIDISAMSGDMTLAQSFKLYGTQFLATLISTIVLARVIFMAGSTTWIQGVMVAFWLWLGFVAAILIGSVIWEKKPLKLFFINAGSYLLTLVVAGAILAAWK